jgi:3-oxoadipate enol-lactonase
MKHFEFGRGEKAFVIIPGLSIHSIMGYAKEIEAAYVSFAEKYRIYVFDRSEKLKKDCSIRDLAEDTAQAMKELKLEKTAVFAASQGGMMAQYLAIDHPELVEKMVLGSTLSRQNKVFRSLCQEWIRLAEERNEKELICSFLDHVYSERSLGSYRDFLIQSNLGITEEEYERFLILGKSCLGFDCYEELSRIKCPVFVMGSKGDRVVTAEAAEETAEALHCQLYLYDESYGHGVYDEAADYKQRMLEFFEAS